MVSNLIGQALTGKPITLYGGGAQTRSFCFVDDMVEGILKLMASDGGPGPVNLGNPEEIRIADLAAMIVEMTGSTSRFEQQPLPNDDPLRRRPDIGLATRTLGWEPRIGLRQGLTRTIAYFREMLGGEAVAGGAAGAGREGKVVRLN